MGDPLSNYGGFTLGKIFIRATYYTPAQYLTTGGAVSARADGDPTPGLILSRAAGPVIVANGCGIGEPGGSATAPAINSLTGLSPKP